jgi:hypothetical protein
MLRRQVQDVEGKLPPKARPLCPLWADACSGMPGWMPRLLPHVVEA